MDKSTKADRDLVNELSGLHVGYLSEDEIESFDRCVADGYAAREYKTDAHALLGIASVRVVGRNDG